MIGNEVFATAFIADIHFGSQKSEALYQQLQERFLTIIKRSTLDLIVFGGDMFHSIITMNYSTSKYVLLFMERVLDICAEQGIPHVRIIQGTMSHDNNQLNNFHIYENRKDVDFRIIPTVTEEVLPEGLRILYVPEEYMADPEGYYKTYLTEDKKYDFIFGHGMFKEVAFVAKTQESEVTMSKAPVFDSKVFINSCKGPIYFGHIHTRISIRNHIHYPGSFSRFRHGEEDPKGWYLNLYDTKTEKYLHEFVINTSAPTYVTITMLMEPNLRPEYVVETIQHTLHTNDNVKLKLIVQDNTDYGYMISYLNEMFQNNKAVKIEIKNEFEFRQETAVDDVVSKVWDKYNFLQDEGIPHEEKIQKFIREKHGKDIPIDIIKDVLNLT